MSLTLGGVRPGFARGFVELRHSFGGAGFVGHALWPTVTLFAMFLLRDTVFEGTSFSLAALMLPSVLGMFVAFGTLLTVQYVAADREDGTVLRAKATPDGVRGYFVGKIVTVSVTVLGYLVFLLVPGWFIVGGLDIEGLGSWLTLALVVLLGLMATQPIGIMLGSMVSGARGAGYMALPVLGLVAVSGIFYPITALPSWIQAVAQAFPMYWLGLGVRSALLPQAAAVVEIGESWRHLETLGVLGAWAVLGLALAPIVVRRMARRETGSSVARRREALLRRVV
jgi:ABC-2 type transport system permease protein